MNLFKKNKQLLFFILLLILFFYPLYLKGLFPIPSDTIVGLYHPYRDFFEKDFSNGVPFKNFLITDPVRQLYPWKNLVISTFQNFNLPLWNPYEMTGKPLLANFQSGAFYPLNILFFFMPFYLSWTAYIIIQPFLLGFFMYIYLKNLKLDLKAVLLGTISVSLSGFVISWLEWGNIIHTFLWLPLLLLSADKIIELRGIRSRVLYLWSIVFLFSLIASFFAGHLQTFFYIFLLLTFYIIDKILTVKKRIVTLLIFFLSVIFFIFITSIQWIPTLQFISLSARGIDQGIEWMRPGWFIPWQHLIQFIAPDFFGNPTTLNYWGVWNYGEFFGYIGIIPLIFSFFALCFRRDRKTLFFGLCFIISVLFAFQSFLAVLPYSLHIPFLSTSQPTRLLGIISFLLSVLAALGLDYFITLFKDSRKNALKFFAVILFLFFGIFMTLWIYVLFLSKFLTPIVTTDQILIAKRNLIFPSVIFLSMLTIFSVIHFTKNKNLRNVLIFLLLLVTFIDLLRYGQKFEAFSKKEYLYPKTDMINFLLKQKSIFRVASTDRRILAPNFSTVYRIQSIEGYDPLYLLSYAEFIAAVERRKPDITAPFGYNRIITPHNFESSFINLLNVRYIMSFDAIENPRFKKVFQERKTILYENMDVLPRVFFVKNIIKTDTKEEAIQSIFKIANKLKDTAVVQGVEDVKRINFSQGDAIIKKYTENTITISVRNAGDGFLVFTDSFYPTWKARDITDGSKYVDVKIYKTNYHFRGIFIPKGKRNIEFYNTLF